MRASSDSLRLVPEVSVRCRYLVQLSASGRAFTHSPITQTIARRRIADP
jgi:hypothetical protein